MLIFLTCYFSNEPFWDLRFCVLSSFILLTYKGNLPSDNTAEAGGEAAEGSAFLIMKPSEIQLWKALGC